MQEEAQRSYRLTYTVQRHDPPVPQDQIPEGHGACDSLILVSILEEDGALSLRFLGRDGKKPMGGDEGDLSPKDHFKTWLFWARALMSDPRLGEGRRAMAQSCFELCMSVFRRGAIDPGSN